MIEFQLNSSLFFLIRDIIFVNEFKILLKSYEVLQTTWERKKIIKNQKTESTENAQSQTRELTLYFYLLMGTFCLFSFHELRADAINSFHNSQPLIKEPI